MQNEGLFRGPVGVGFCNKPPNFEVETGLFRGPAGDGFFTKPTNLK
jgi:hypothetical protein